MTSIGSTGFDPVSAGRAMMNARISSAVSSGSISSTDQSAFATALDGIDSAMGTASTSRSAGSGSMRDRIDGLIDKQVAAGTLTDDQASELKDLFAQRPGQTGTGAAGDGQGGDGATGDMQAMGGMGGPMGMQGPPPPPPPPSDTDDDSDSTTTSATASAASTTSTSATSGTDTKQIDTLISFLETLRANLGSSSATYGTSSTNSDSSNTGVLVDATA